MFNNNTTGTEIYASGQIASAQRKCRKKNYTHLVGIINNTEEYYCS